VETVKRFGRFGRSCRVCKLYFLTSDPNAYICPWCNKGKEEVALAEVGYVPGRDMTDTQMLIQEEV
jgi:hypothetical protein